MRKGRKKRQGGEEKERNPERGGGVRRRDLMHGRSPAPQPGAPSPPSLRPSLARLETRGSPGPPPWG